MLLLGLLAFTLTLGNANAQNPKVELSSPSWVREGVIYEIYPRDFSPEGNFNGVTARLNDLQSLGVTILWLMPIHPIGEKFRKGTFGSPYAVKDYYAINPDYGTEADLKHLIGEAHRRGLKVIMDMVANHTAWDSVLMNHPEFYKQDAAGKILPPDPAWRDVAGLNYANPQLRQYMIAMFKHWVDPSGFDFDGFRCDVAENVPLEFWQEARAELLKTKPDLMLLAEGCKPELTAKAFDLDYSWPLLHALNNVLMEGASAADIRRCWEENYRQFRPGALHMRMSDDHDECRAIARFGLKGALAASALMFTLDGVPMLYNGMEAGDVGESGDPALFEKLPIFWHPKDRPPLTEVYRELIALRKQYAAFRDDKVVWLHNSAEGSLATFMRGDGKDEFVVVINFSNRPVTAHLNADAADQFKPVKISGLPGDSERALPDIQLGAFEWRIYHRTMAAPFNEVEQNRPPRVE
ncbi:MAG TPA: alpha-amylase family glycosyl hydrolase [Candidatus Saccharimonadales bacterium]|nr:alpha-amylase family glycosyl hydrolase [Candidatus Saccharimonadales bacterium]